MAPAGSGSNASHISPGWLSVLTGEPADRETAEEPQGRWVLNEPQSPGERPALTWRERVAVSSLAHRSIAVPVIAAVVLFVAASVVTLWLMWGQPGETTAPFVEAGVSESSGAGVIDEAGEPAAAEIAIAVHVIGEVVKPGVIELPQGARVLDALTAAGGASEAAVLTGVNLARLVIDGEQIVVPNLEQALAPETTAQDPGAGGGGGGTALVSLNSASVSDFETLPRVGPALAARIVEWRAANGGFRTIDQLGEVSGIGEKTLESLKPLVTL